MAKYNSALKERGVLSWFAVECARHLLIDQRWVTSRAE